MSDLRLVPSSDESTAGLRRAVLRAGHDEVPLFVARDGYHLAVYDGDRVVATGNIGREEPDWDRESDVDAWRIHGMATDPEYRGRGAGGMVLAGLIDHARLNGAELVWCHARVGARGFYLRHGFTAYGDEWFMPPPYGPHVAMQLTL